MGALIQPLRELDWEDVDAVEHFTTQALATILAAPGAIREALVELPDRPDLLRLCEHYDVLDKIVLDDDKSGVRLRLHIFGPGYYDRPHNHRWSYASTILRGEYRHYLFGDAELDETVHPADLTPLLVRQERVGYAYALHHTMVHAVVAEPFTVSLVLRGPAVKGRFLVMDRNNGTSWWQYGASLETAESAEQKRMSPKRLRNLTDQLIAWELF